MGGSGNRERVGWKGVRMGGSGNRWNVNGGMESEVRERSGKEGQWSMRHKGKGMEVTGDGGPKKRVTKNTSEYVALFIDGGGHSQ